jgi:hypothetical protein
MTARKNYKINFGLRQLTAPEYCSTPLLSSDDAGIGEYGFIDEKAESAKLKLLKYFRIRKVFEEEHKLRVGRPI